MGSCPIGYVGKFLSSNDLYLEQLCLIKLSHYPIFLWVNKRTFVTDTLSEQKVAIILAGTLKDFIDVGVMSGLMLLNAIIGFSQELKAKNTVDSLKKDLALKTIALRDGLYSEVDVISLVPGDIIRLEEVSHSSSQHGHIN